MIELSKIATLRMKIAVANVGEKAFIITNKEETEYLLALLASHIRWIEEIYRPPMRRAL